MSAGLAELTSAEATALAQSALIGAGAADDVAIVVAAHVVEAEEAGHPSHGLRQIPIYCVNAGRPGYDLQAIPQVEQTRHGVTTVDAGGGLGYLALAVAVDCAAGAAREHGVAISAVRRCGHAGRAGAWAERGSQAGCVSLVALGGSDPPFVLAAAPGARPALHTNPVAIAVPGDGAPLLLDMATSMVAEGKVHVALAAGTSLPAGSILSPEGEPSGDPADFVRGGSLLPAGGHKGFGLSAMVEALAVSLTGADSAGLEPREGALVICIDAGAFRPAAQLSGSVELLRARIRGSGACSKVMAPGDPEWSKRAGAAGRIAVDPVVLGQVRELARRRAHR